MVINNGKIRPIIQEKGLLKMLQNLCFIWVVYHSHSFSDIILATYWKFKPSMLCQEVSIDRSKWSEVDEKMYIPHIKVLI
jgi:hypothetical protein